MYQEKPLPPMPGEENGYLRVQPKDDSRGSWIDINSDSEDFGEFVVRDILGEGGIHLFGDRGAIVVAEPCISFYTVTVPFIVGNSFFMLSSPFNLFFP